MVVRPPFTEEQLINKTLIEIKLAEVFETATMELNQFDIQTWYELNTYFSDANNTYIGIGARTSGITSYHSAANVVDDNSLGLITNSIA